MQTDSHKENLSNIKFIPFLLSEPQLGYILRYLSPPTFTNPSHHLSPFSPVPFPPTRCQISEDQISQKLEPGSSLARGINRLVRLVPSSFSARGKHYCEHLSDSILLTLRWSMTHPVLLPCYPPDPKLQD